MASFLGGRAFSHGAHPSLAWLSLGVILLASLLLLTRNLPWHLDDYDQAKQAYTSFEMKETGQWWFQHTPTQNVATKPPLAGWISAALHTATGGISWDLAWRLPPLLCALAIGWFLWKRGEEAGGWLAAWTGFGAFAFNLFTPRLATLVRTDMMLTACIFGAGLLVYDRIRRGEEWSARHRWLLFAFVLASMLVKGPIAYAFLLPGLLAYLWLERKKPGVRQAWSGWWPWFTPLIFFGAWVAIGCARDFEFYDQVVNKEFLGRFTVGERAVHNNQPIFYYLAKGGHYFFPWSVLAIVAACSRDLRERVRREPALLWLFCWFAGGLLFMSLVPSKRADRVFPVIPPLCLLLAAILPLVRPGQIKWSMERIIGTALVVAVLFSGGYALYRVVEGYQTRQSILVEFGRTVRKLKPDGAFAVVSGKDEGLLLYTNKTQFTRAKDALELWQAGKIDAVVLPLRHWEKDRESYAPSRVLAEAPQVPEKGSGYVLIARDGQPPAP